MIHDHSLFFDDDGKVYIISGVGSVSIREMKSDLSGLDDNVPSKVIIEKSDSIIGSPIRLAAEGAQVFKIDGKYYIFLITCPHNGMRTVLLYRSDNIMGPFEGRIALKDRGIAQGGIIDTPDGKWYGYFFRDYGSVGRIPYLVPMEWDNGWPVFGNNGNVGQRLQ